MTTFGVDAFWVPVPELVPPPPWTEDPGCVAAGKELARVRARAVAAGVALGGGGVGPARGRRGGRRGPVRGGRRRSTCEASTEHICGGGDRSREPAGGRRRPGRGHRRELRALDREQAPAHL